MAPLFAAERLPEDLAAWADEEWLLSDTAERPTDDAGLAAVRRLLERSPTRPVTGAGPARELVLTEPLTLDRQDVTGAIPAAGVPQEVAAGPEIAVGAQEHPENSPHDA
ncbi:hypothetical protein ACI79J_16390 [Geodermatophilus sp. SYSU D01062]